MKSSFKYGRKDSAMLYNINIHSWCHWHNSEDVKNNLDNSRRYIYSILILSRLNYANSCKRVLLIY